MLEIKTGVIPTREELLELYSSVDWTAYTNDPEKLERAVRNSKDVYTAWEAGRLVGLLRTVGDGEIILYVQDLLVAPDCRGLGIGEELLRRLKTDYEDIPQKVLLADSSEKPTEKLIDFYCARGWYPADTWGCTAFLNFEC